MSLRRQCALLDLNRSTGTTSGVPGRLDRGRHDEPIRDIWEARPFYGYRKIAEVRAAPAMSSTTSIAPPERRWGSRRCTPRPRPADPGRDHVVHPYLLQDLDIVRPGQVWQVDITYIKLPVGFAYLVALIDVYSRRIMGMAPVQLDEPDVLSRGAGGCACPRGCGHRQLDQGAQFTAKDWVSALEDCGIRASWTEGVAWTTSSLSASGARSNTRRYLRVYESLPEARRCIGPTSFYNSQRPPRAGLQYARRHRRRTGPWI